MEEGCSVNVAHVFVVDKKNIILGVIWNSKITCNGKSSTKKVSQIQIGKVFCHNSDDDLLTQTLMNIYVTKAVTSRVDVVSAL